MTAELRKFQILAHERLDAFSTRSRFIDVVEELVSEISLLGEQSDELERTNHRLRSEVRQLKIVIEAKDRFAHEGESSDEKGALRDENVILRTEVKRLERLLNSRQIPDRDSSESFRPALKSSFRSCDSRDGRQIQFSRQSVGEDGRFSMRRSLPNENMKNVLSKRVSLDAPPSPLHKKGPLNKSDPSSLVMNAVRSENASGRRARSKQSLFYSNESHDGSFRFVPIEQVMDSEAIGNLVSVMSKVEACKSHDLVAVARAMTASKVQEGENLCIEGEPGLYFIVIIEGEYLQETTGRPTRELRRNDSIGEAVFIHPYPMASSSVKCTSPNGGLVWTIHTEVLRQVMREVAMRSSSIDLSDVRIGRTIGRGGTAVVKLATVPKEDETKFYALKIIKKRTLEKHNKLSLLQNERFILSQLDSPFVIKLRTTLKDDRHIFFLLELAPGGDLLTVLNNLGVLTRSQSQFYTACIISALDHCHARGVVYRDLKPENLLVDSQGYLKLSDFGVAKKLISLENDTTYSLVGTPQFIAPEVILGRGYGREVDLWSLGCCVYEFITGELSFPEEQNQFEQFQRIIHFNPSQLTFAGTPPADLASQNFVKALLCPNPKLRLGSKSFEQIKNDAFFENASPEDEKFSWERFLDRKLKPPFEPVLRPLSSSCSTSSEAPLSDDITSNSAASPALSSVSWTSFKDPVLYI